MCYSGKINKNHKMRHFTTDLHLHTAETLNEGKGTHLLRIFKNMFLLHNLVGPIVFKVLKLI